MSVSRLVRPQQRGPARPGMSIELWGVIALGASMWAWLIHNAGAFMGWW